MRFRCVLLGRFPGFLVLVVLALRLCNVVDVVIILVFWVGWICLGVFDGMISWVVSELVSWYNIRLVLGFVWYVLFWWLFGGFRFLV